MAIIGLEPLTVDECWTLASSVPVGRVFIDAGDHQAILPVIFVVHARTIAFRTAPGDKLVAAAMHQHTVFEVDAFDEATHTGWSVNINGACAEVVDVDEISELDHFGLPVWAAPGIRNRWVRITPEHVSGRRIRPGASAPGE